MTDQPADHSSDNPQPSQTPPVFDPNADHQNKPKIRKVRGVPMPVTMPNGEKATMLGLADAQQISQKLVMTLPAFQMVIPMMDGVRDIDQIVSEAGNGLERPMLEQLVAQLDDAGLLFGPVFEEMAQKMRDAFDGSDTLPPGSTAQLADMLVNKALGEEGTEEQKLEMGGAELKKQFDLWIDASLKDVENTSFDQLPAAVIAPHIDYIRGWMNYGHTYGRMRVVNRPDRVIILGTNHFGQSTGVCGCNKGYESPIGTCPLDSEFLDALKVELGADNASKLLQNRFDHENEHSIELHIPWIQHVFGADDFGVYPKVFGALIHDPTINNGESYDEQGLGLDPFIEALKSVISKLSGTTLVISSADLSHVGPAFGDQQHLAGETEEAQAFRSQVATHDQEMLKMIANNKMDDLIGAMAWQQNPTRWCSIGNISATMRVIEPGKIDLLNYAAAMDPQGTAFVSSASLALYR